MVKRFKPTRKIRDRYYFKYTVLRVPDSPSLLEQFISLRFTVETKVKSSYIKVYVIVL